MRKFSLLLAAIFCTATINSQFRIPMLGETAPSFKAKTTNGDLNFPQDFGESWKILISHPEDFTPVCTSEIMHLAKMQDDFSALNVRIAIISTDNLSSHFQWKQSMEKTLKELTGNGKIDFPLIADNKAHISMQYGMLHSLEDDTHDVRAVFIINPENKIRSINFYPMDIGRNMEEIKRTIVALQTSEQEKVLLPVNWQEGDDILMKRIPYSEEELKNNPSLASKYYKVGLNMWFKKGL